MEVFIHLYGPEDDFSGAGAMFLAPFPAGMILGWVVGLPRWWLIAVAAPFVNMAIIVLGLRGLTVPELMELGSLPGSLMFAAIGAGGHIAATAMLGQVDRTLRLSVIGALVVGFAGMSWNTDAIREAARAQRLAHSGIPLIGLGSQQYRPVHLAEWFGEWEAGPPSIELSYARLRDRAEIQLYVMPGTVGVPQTACSEPLPDVANRRDVSGSCRQVSTDVWVRTESAGTRVFAKHENALVQVASDRVSEADLLLILPTLRRTTAEELAAIGEI
ncbi:hypothetical protein BKM31_41065 [[Actinomadura] parvosata subsp. kistnae]|uniref:Uncharacterized protein n=2 Tax=Nonomuraea TaxID=83681 RepID=A0A1V0A9Z7_9ACTN|nr:hypothetical protein BKM31_41065 [Nonomuraea sp. ATCC 55076]